MPPTSADVVLDLSAMDQVLDHAAGDLIVATQAGARLRDVQDVVAREGQQLAVDETVPGASIGGTLATNASGPRRMTTGTMRDLLIGLTVVRADGVVAKAGGRVVKNVAGYDLGKLMVGSYGTLAVVIEALFRLHPLPETRRSVTTWVSDAQQAQERVQQVLGAQCVPSAVEVWWPNAVSPGRQGAVGVLLEGREAGVRARAAAVQRLWGGDAEESENELDVSLPWDVTDQGDERFTTLKLTHRLSGLAEVLATAREVDTAVTLRGSAGSGVLYGAIPNTVPVETVVAAVDSLRAACTRQQGSCVVLDAPGAVKQDVDVWGPIPALDLMRRVKERFDPERLLSPGRFVGGI